MSIFSDPFINWRRVRFYSIIAVLVWVLSVLLLIQENKPTHKRVVLFLIDGLRADAIEKLGPELAPNLHFLIRNGASTMNARTDPRSTETLPNSISMLTGRPVFDGDRAHKYLSNVYTGRAVHDFRNAYIHSVFDVLHRNNYRSSFFAAKNKFGVFVKSYIDEKNVGAKRKGGKDPARFQSFFITNTDDEQTFEKFLIDLVHFHSHFIFLHLSGPDQAGHKSGWSLDSNAPYMDAVIKMDQYLGSILKAINKKRYLKGNVYLIVTSDHGGDGENHVDPFNRHNYTVPFIVWGPGVAKGADLYALNPETRRDPKENIIVYDSDVQPVRNADAGNLALDLLELPPIPDSAINVYQDLRVKP